MVPSWPVYRPPREAVTADCGPATLKDAEYLDAAVYGFGIGAYFNQWNYLELLRIARFT